MEDASFWKERAQFAERRTSFAIQLILLACLTVFLVACLTIDKLKGFQILSREAWRWWGLLFAVVEGGVATVLLVDALKFCLGRCNSMLERKIKTRTRKLEEREQPRSNQQDRNEVADVETRTQKPEQAGEARSNLQDRNEDEHVLLNIHDQPQPKSRQGTSEEDLEERKYLKFLEKLLEFWEKVEQVLGACQRSMGFVIWVAGVLSAWILLFPKGVELPEHRSEILNITKALAAVLAVAAVWMAKTIWLQVLAFSYIVDRSRERIAKALSDQKLLQEIWSITGYPNGFPNKEMAVDDEPQMRTNSGSGSNDNGKDTKKKWLMLPAALDQMKHERHWTPRSTILKIVGTGLPVLAEDKDDIGNVERAARVTAGWFFEQLVEVHAQANGSTEDHQQRPTVSKSRCVLINENQEELLRKLEEVTPAVRSFDITRTDENKMKVEMIERIPRIRKSELEEWLVKVYVDRFVLLRTINGRDDILCDLNRILSIMVIVFDIVLFLFITGLLTTKVAIVIAAQIVALSFMFGDSTKTTFKAFFFLFESRPFDVGDRCKIKEDDDKGQKEENQVDKVVVNDMNFLSTIFIKHDGQEIYYPNSVLIDKNIENFHLVPDTRDVIEFKTKAPVVDLENFCEELAQKIKPYLEKKRKHWHSDSSDFYVVIEKVANEEENHLVVLTFKHRVNYDDRREWTKHREELLSEVARLILKHWRDIIS